MVGLRRRITTVLAMALFLTGCATGPPNSSATDPNGNQSAGSATSRPPLHGTLLDPPLAPPTQTLRDTAGRPFSVASTARQQLTLLFFGYTHCPDLCPTTVNDLAQARATLPNDLRDRVTVVVVTEDPRRDKPATLRRWLDEFDPTFVGLIGGNPTSAAMLKQLYLPETTRDLQPSTAVRHSTGHNQDEHGEYGINHAGIVYAFTPDGRTVIYTGGTTSAQYAADFTLLLTTSR